MKYLQNLLVLLTLAMSAGISWGQDARGTILGRITDTQNAVVPNAAVLVQNIDTGISLPLKSNADGNYEAPFLLLGNYRVTAEANGFKRTVRNGIALRVNDKLEVNLTLELGATSDTISVTAEAPLLETATASLGSVVDARRVAELPVPYGEPYALVGLAGGASFAGSPTLDRPFDPSHLANYAMDGSRGLRNELSIDGTPTGASTANPGEVSASYVPPIDTIGELKVQTAVFDASVGQTEGGAVNISLKSGTNTLHGTGYYFKLDPSLNGNDFFANRSGLPRAIFDTDRWGASLTGPVVLPKIYNGHNRTFFMYGYEGIHDLRSRGGVNTVPTAAERNGDFSALLALGTNYQLYDPLTRRAVANGRYQEDPIPGNIIPANRISPIAKSILKYYALPNTAGTVDGRNNLSQPNLPETAGYYTNVARVDHNLSDKQRIFVRGNGYNRNSTYSDYFGNVSTGEWFWFHSAGASIDEVYTLSPTFILNVRYGYNRFIRQIDRNPEGKGFDLTSLGLPAAYNNAIPADVRRFPYINISGYYGTNGGITWRPQDTHDWVAAFDKIKGGQALKFGAEFRIYKKNDSSPNVAATGQLAFSDTYTKGPLDNSTSAPVGGGLASFLLGFPTGGSVTRPANFAEQSDVWAFYFQDDWKVSRKLTVNLGLRYEVETAMRESSNRSVTGFDFNAAQPIAAAAIAAYAKNPTPEVPASQFKVQGGLLFAGVNGQPTGLWNPPHLNFMPRIGLAYQLGNKTVVRAGYGIFDDDLGVRRGDVNQTGFSYATNLVPSLDSGLSFIASLANPFPAGIQDAPGASLGTQTNLGQGVTFFNQHPKTPYMQRWQVGIQHQLPGRLVLDITYVGNRGTHLETSRDLNALPLQYLSTKPTRDQATIDYLSTNLANPFANLLPNTTRNGSTIGRSTLLLPYPQYGSVTTTTNQGYSWYHSLQLKVDKRFSHGFTVQSSYTYSKFMEATGFLNAADPLPARTISDQDYPHRLTASSIYELPFGKGRMLFSGAPRGVSAAISGWQVQGIFAFQSGQALTFGNLIYYGGSISLPSDQRTVEHWLNASAFETNSKNALGNNVRTFPQRFSNIRGPSSTQVDLSAIKNTKITERVNVQLRAEFLNAFNHAIFSNPSTDPTSSAYGTITSTRAYPRRGQLGIKVIF